VEGLMNRCVVNFATGPYVPGATRLMEQVAKLHGVKMHFRVQPRVDWPPHSRVPYAFKACALEEVSGAFDTLLWCDASIVLGARPLTDLFELIEQQGYWFANNGWTNYEWTADSAYPDLFPGHDIDNAREANRKIPHVVATAFGLSMRHPTGRVFLAEYYRLATKTNAFCGPWKNEAATPCGPADVRGHRHDQTAASVIASRLKMELTTCPEWFAYAGNETDKTCLIAKGI
jgi:hypothetical protein